MAYAGEPRRDGATGALVVLVENGQDIPLGALAFRCAVDLAAIDLAAIDRAAIDRPAINRAVIDLAAIDVLLRLRLAASRRGWSLRLTGVDEDLRGFVDLLGLSDCLGLGAPPADQAR
jgi:ABC-type transporter Mla MlaB component